MAPRAGDPLPDVTVSEDEPGNKFSIRDVFTGKKGVLVGVPGAFTPGCSQQHLPTYVEQYEGLKEAGADVIACISVNDPFVMRAWGESSGAKGKVRMIADFKGELVSAMGVELDMGDILGGTRSKRFSAVVENNTIKYFNLEEAPDKFVCSLADNAIKQLKSL